MAFCPNCSREVAQDAAACAACQASFGPGSTWRPLAEPPQAAAPAPAGAERVMLKIVLPLYCAAISLLCIFGGGVALLFTLGVGYVWIAPLMLLLYGMGNLLLTMGAFAPAGRRIVRVSAYASIALAAALIVSTRNDVGHTVLWCGALYLNWLAIRKLVDMHLS